MKTLKVTTRNSVYTVVEDGLGNMKVTACDTPERRHIHDHIVNNEPHVTVKPIVGGMMQGWNWHTSTVVAVEEV